MSLHSNNSLDDHYSNTRIGSPTTSSSSKYPSPLEKLPDMHQPSQWYSTSHPPYELDCWKEVFRERHEKDHIVRMLLDEMVEDSRNRMRHMDGIAGIGMAHARDVLENIIHGRNGEAKDLSRTYYAQKTLKRLQRGWVLDQWRGYRSGHQSFPIWQGCGLMAMFSDQTMELTDLDRQFQELADEFLAVSPIHGRGATSGGLGSAGSSAYGEDGLDGSDSRSATTTAPPVYVSSNHYPAGIDRYSPGSLLETSSSSSGRWPISPDRMQERIDETNEQYQRHYDAQVDRLKDLIRFFTREKGFKGNTENYYDPFNSLIDKVLTRKVGIPISLSIVFAELAERVGVHGVELMGFPQHFMLRYRPLVLGAGGFHGSPLLGGHDGAGPPAPPTYFLDLFHPPHRLLSMDEYEDYFASLNIPRPMTIYRDLATPPLEIFLRCLRNIILAVEQTGGAGRIGSDHQTSLYSGITQLLALHPIEEWGLYVLWLKYLGNFWPEDVGFVRTAIEDMELSDHRRMAGRRTTASPTQQQQQRPHHTYVRGRGGLQAAAGSASHYASSTQETVKILRAHVRELEMADEVGEVGEIRRRRRPKVAAVASNYSPLATSSASLSPDLPRLSSSVEPSTTSTSHPGQRRSSVPASEVPGSSASPTTASASSPTMDNHVSHAHHQYLSQNSISGEQQNGSSSSITSGVPSEEDENSRPLMRVASMFGGEERRRPEPEYYVGEVFRHLIYRYTGVIYGYNLSKFFMITRDELLVVINQSS
ncbi:MAG: Transglutaminase-like superfamily-domain-containing protein [Linnemannia elongata]|nr:MAG: Transglutaminase-like superfamily-domain-containing protein [Linnemannia elongata]